MLSVQKWNFKKGYKNENQSNGGRLTIKALKKIHMALAS